jgi:cytochrome c
VKQAIELRCLIAILPIWFSCALLSLPHVEAAAALPAGNAASGKLLFEKRCTGCHALDKKKEGPRLHDIYGRKAGSLSDFSYSDELKAAHIIWDDRSLDQWLANPEAVVPNNDMAFHVSNPQERADIIQFLRLSSGK